MEGDGGSQVRTGRLQASTLRVPGHRQTDSTAPPAGRPVGRDPGAQILAPTPRPPVKETGPLGERTLGLGQARRTWSIRQRQQGGKSPGTNRAGAPTAQAGTTCAAASAGASPQHTTNTQEPRPAAGGRRGAGESLLPEVLPAATAPRGSRRIPTPGRATASLGGRQRRREGDQTPGRPHPDQAAGPA